MFTIFKNNRKVRNAPTFHNYERARSYVRSLIRKNSTKINDLFWTTNPMIGDYAYSVRKI